MMKFSKNFERDYCFYLSNRNIFNFSGVVPKYKAIPDEYGYTAKECMFYIDSCGKNVPRREPELLSELLMCKASVNFHIKMWADGMKREILFEKDLDEIQQSYGCPDWVTTAVKNQCKSLMSKEGWRM